ESVAATLRRDTWASLAAAGLDSVPVNTFSYYDQMLDTAVMLDALPARATQVPGDLDRYFAAARGNSDVSPDAPALAEAVYNKLGAVSNRPSIYVATYFGDPGAALAGLARTPVEAIGVDLVYGADTAVAAVPELAGKILVAGVVDGRNVWRTDLEAALGKLAPLLGSTAGVAVSTSCSTLHVPYSLEPETELDEALR